MVKETLQKPKLRHPSPTLVQPELELFGLQFSDTDLVSLRECNAGENYTHILYALVKFGGADVSTVLEIGIGGSSVIIASVLAANRGVAPRLHSIDTDLDKPTLQMLETVQALGVDWQVVHGDSLKVPLSLLPASVDLLYIDGDHGGEHAIGDYRKFAPLVRAGGLVVFDDYPTFSGVSNGVLAIVAELTTEGVVGKTLTYNLQDGNSFYVIQR